MKLQKYGLYIVVCLFFPFIYAVTIYKYRIYCDTEQQFVYTWSETAPTKCPTNTNHLINSASITVVDEKSDNEITIKQESTPTGGNFRTETWSITAPAGPDVTTTVTRSWPLSISCMELKFISTAEHTGDLITIEVPKNKTCGTITAPVAPGNTIISVTQSAINVIAVGFFCSITDGTNTNNLGRILSIDKINKTITVETAATTAFAVGTPTLVQLTIQQVAIEIGEPGTYVLGDSTIGGSYLPANEVVYVTYTNKGSQQKKLVMYYEYLY